MKPAEGEPSDPQTAGVVRYLLDRVLNAENVGPDEPLRNVRVERSPGTFTLHLLRTERWRWLVRLYLLVGAWFGGESLRFMIPRAHAAFHLPLFRVSWLMASTLTGLVFAWIAMFLLPLVPVATASIRGLGGRALRVTPTTLEVVRNVGPLRWIRAFPRATLRQWRIDAGPEWAGNLTRCPELALYASLDGRDVEVAGAIPEIRAVHRLVLEAAPEIGAPGPDELARSPDRAQAERVADIEESPDGARIRIGPPIDGIGRRPIVRLALLLIVPLMFLAELHREADALRVPDPHRWVDDLVVIGFWLVALGGVLWSRAAETLIAISQGTVEVRWRVGWMPLLRFRRPVSSCGPLRVVRRAPLTSGRVALQLPGIARLKRELLNEELVEGLTAADAFVIREALVKAAPTLAGPARVVRPGIPSAREAEREAIRGGRASVPVTIG